MIRLECMYNISNWIHILKKESYSTQDKCNVLVFSYMYLWTISLFVFYFIFLLLLIELQCADCAALNNFSLINYFKPCPTYFLWVLFKSIVLPWLTGTQNALCITHHSLAWSNTSHGRNLNIHQCNIESSDKLKARFLPFF